jgi:hypothetical protein
MIIVSVVHKVFLKDARLDRTKAVVSNTFYWLSYKARVSMAYMVWVSSKSIIQWPI